MDDRAIVEEMMRRQRAQQGLIDFTRYTFPGYRPAEHHYIMGEALEAVEAGRIKRLMIFMPPRHGKSELASKRFPAWCLGRDPHKNFISASYNSDLAGDFGREVRNIILEPDYRNVFPGTEIASDSGSAPRWHTTGRGSYVAAGIGTAVTGRGAHIFTIDDPVKDRLDADSERQRQRTYDWYKSTAYTRLESSLREGLTEEDLFWDVSASLREGLIKPFEGAVVLIQTRWHEDDLAGKLLEDMGKGADQWKVIDMPAIDKGNRALWPSKYPLEKLLEIKKAVGAREFSALYQQQPQPDDGDYFKRDHFTRYHPSELPDNMTVWMTSDFAVSEGKGDYTEHTIWGVDEFDYIYLLDNWHGQTSPVGWIDSAIRLLKKHKPQIWYAEGGVIRRSVEPFLRKAMEDYKTYVTIKWINPIGDKTARARAFQARVESFKVCFPEGDMGDRALDQLIRFPTGKWDDFVDTCSLLGLVIHEICGSSEPQYEKKTRTLRDITFDDMMKSYVNDKNEYEERI